MWGFFEQRHHVDHREAFGDDLGQDLRQPRWRGESAQDRRVITDGDGCSCRPANVHHSWLASTGMSTGDRLPHVFPLGTAPQIPGLVLTHNRTSQSCRWVDPNGNGPKTNAETAAWGVITRGITPLDRTPGRPPVVCVPRTCRSRLCRPLHPYVAAGGADDLSVEPLHIGTRQPGTGQPRLTASARHTLHRITPPTAQCRPVADQHLRHSSIVPSWFPDRGFLGSRAGPM